MGNPNTFSDKSYLIRAAFLPSLGVGFTFFAYGTQSRLADFSAMEHFLSTSIVYAVPGMLALVELTASSSSLLNITVSVLLVNLRLMPMTMSLVPLIRTGKTWRDTLVIHFVALTTWLTYFNHHSKIQKEKRGSFYVRLALTIWVISNCLGLVGYYVAGVVPDTVLTGLIFSNPLYFMCLLLGQMHKLQNFLAISVGALLLPIMIIYFADWSVLASGMIGGTIVYIFMNVKKEIKKNS